MFVWLFGFFLGFVGLVVVVVEVELLGGFFGLVDCFC